MTAECDYFSFALAVREMAKVLGYPLPLIDRATKFLPSWQCAPHSEHRRELAIVLGDSPALECAVRPRGEAAWLSTSPVAA
jgi:hypothetical protein